MKKPIETLRSQNFFKNNMQLFINRATEDFSLPLHNHEFIEFSYIAEGNGFHYVEDAVHPVRKGELYYIPIGVPHVFRPVSTNLSKHPLVVYNCVCPPDLLMKLIPFSSSIDTKQFIESLYNQSVPYFSLIDMDETAEKIFLTMHREYSLPQSGSADYLHALLLQLLIIIQRIKQDNTTSNQGDPFTRFDQLLNYMEQHCTEELTLAHLAKISLWSERHLQRLFIQHTEQSFSRYLQTLRIQKSRELLRSSQHKISAIAGLVGYKDVGYFFLVFKRIVGKTPSEYRRSVTGSPKQIRA